MRASRWTAVGIEAVPTIGLRAAVWLRSDFPDAARAPAPPVGRIDVAIDDLDDSLYLPRQGSSAFSAITTPAPR